MKNKELLFSVTKDDCIFDCYVGSGKGGQKRNKTSNCVRCTHIESGATATSENGRSQRHNKEMAFKKMAETKEFKLWHKLECSRRSGELDLIKKNVEKALHPSNLKVECKDNGLWKKYEA